MSNVVPAAPRSCTPSPRTRVRAAAAAALLAIALVATIAAPPAPLLVWNVSASAPVGLYAVTQGVSPRVGFMVLARMPAGYGGWAVRRGYVPSDIALIKEVAALPGDHVCARGSVILVNGRAVAVRRSHDARGRRLPRWKGCAQLSAGTLLLLNPDSPGSFDGRYFGPTAAADVIGRVRLLWRR